MNENSLSKMHQLKLYGMQRAFESLIEPGPINNSPTMNILTCWFRPSGKTGRTAALDCPSEQPASGIMPVSKKSILSKTATWTKTNFSGLPTVVLSTAMRPSLYADLPALVKAF